MKLAWLTDIHLNVIDKAERLEFYRRIKETSCDATLISGDIAEATSIESILTEMVQCLNMPIYFILGNHDYYGSQVDHVRDKVKVLSKQEANVCWLPETGYHSLSDDVILVGQDGWADGRYGDITKSQVSLNDSRLIVDLFQRKIVGKNALLHKMQELADADAMQLQVNLKAGIANCLLDSN